MDILYCILDTQEKARNNGIGDIRFPKFIERLVSNSFLMALWDGIWEQNKRWRPKFGPTIPL